MKNIITIDIDTDTQESTLTIPPSVSLASLQIAKDLLDAEIRRRCHILADILFNDDEDE